jgi:hypothetical protein
LELSIYGPYLTLRIGELGQGGLVEEEKSFLGFRVLKGIEIVGKGLRKDMKGLRLF